MVRTYIFPMQDGSTCHFCHQSIGTRTCKININSNFLGEGDTSIYLRKIGQKFLAMNLHYNIADKRHFVVELSINCKKIDCSKII